MCRFLLRRPWGVGQEPSLKREALWNEEIESNLFQSPAHRKRAVSYLRVAAGGTAAWE